MTARENVQVLLGTVTEMSGKYPEIRTALKGVEKDLSRIRDLLNKDPDSFRADRGFFLVRSKNLNDALRLYPQLHESGDKDARDLFLRDITVAFRPVSDARSALEKIFTNEALIAVSVLADQADPAPREPIVKTARSWGGKALSMISQPKETVTQAATDAGRYVGNKAGALTSLAGTGVDQLGVMMSKSITDRVLIRLFAAKAASESAIGSGAMTGILLGILCPPLLPLTGGVAALSAMRAWNQEIESMSRMSGINADENMKEIKDRRREAMMKITGGSSTAETQTDHVSVLVDGDTGSADVTLLSGPHVGKRFAELSESDKKKEKERWDGETLEIFELVGMVLTWP